MHTLKRKSALKTSARVGRGGKRGKTAGRGTKGQNARSGRKKRPEERDMIKKIPKMRGRGKNSNTTIQTKAFAIPVMALETLSKGEVNVRTLIANKIIQLPKRQRPVVKILGTGKLSKAFTLKGIEVSATAKKAIEDAGGAVK